VGADNTDNDDDSNDGSLPSVEELLSSAVSTTGSAATDQRRGHISKQNVAGTTGPSSVGGEDGLERGISADSRTSVSISSPEVANSENGKNGNEDEEDLRSVKQLRDTWNCGDVRQKPREGERAGGKRQADEERKDEVGDDDGDGSLRPAKRPLKGRRLSSPSSQQISSTDELDGESDRESDGESDGSYVAPALHQNKQPGPRRCRRRSTSNFAPPSCSGTTGTASNVISDLDPECLELPIQGSLGIRIIGSETFYTLNFRQDPYRQRPSPGRHPYTKVHKGPAGKSGRTPRLPCKKFKFTREEDESLVELKERRGLSWKEIEPLFPGRSAGTLQVHYSTKLKAGARTVGKSRGRR
jgi:hypothetical protein